MNRRAVSVNKRPPAVNVGVGTRVRIVDPKHPHFPETGTFVGNTIRLVTGDVMTELKLDSCRHGTGGCFVSKGQVSLLVGDAS